jgi:hypothetical protein
MDDKAEATRLMQYYTKVVTEGILSHVHAGKPVNDNTMLEIIRTTGLSQVVFVHSPEAIAKKQILLRALEELKNELAAIAVAKQKTEIDVEVVEAALARLSL